MAKACVLEGRTEEVMTTWERLSRAYFDSASDKSRVAVRDHLPPLLDALVEVLKSRDFERPIELSRIHGRQRFSFGDYALKDVLGEYVLLKNIVFDILERHDPDFFEDFRLVDRFFSAAMTIAAEEFAALREADIKAMSATLEATNRDLERFAAVAAHDLRSPAATIVGYADLALEEHACGHPDEENYASLIRKTSLRMVSLIEQLLAYTKIGPAKLDAQTFSVADVLGEARADLEAQLQGTDVHFDIQRESLGQIKGDRILFTQLFQNLLANSLKFRDPDRALRIDVWGERADGRARIFVRDNGRGFNAEAGRTIFEPFIKGHSDPSIEGSGLGLATVQRIVDVHGGHISADGRPNHGAQFEIDLPLSQNV